MLDSGAAYRSLAVVIVAMKFMSLKRVQMEDGGCPIEIGLNGIRSIAR